MSAEEKSRFYAENREDMPSQPGSPEGAPSEASRPEAALFRAERLEGEACRKLRPLWEEVFHEDSKEFTDYYFREKAHRNHGYVLRKGEAAAAMLYLSPYPMMIRTGDSFSCREINYIVGVATKAEYRHRGCMDRLLKEALQDMYGKGHPFTFLMPADPEIYYPYQFAYIYSRAERCMPRRLPGGFRLCGSLGSGTDLRHLADFARNCLERDYDMFIRRDEAYFGLMEKELKAQRGGIYLKEGTNGIEGYYLYTQEGEKREVQEAVFSGEEPWEDCPMGRAETVKPVIMARIADVRAMLSLLRAEEEVRLDISVADPILTGNRGVWECFFSEKRAEIAKKDARRKHPCGLAVSIEALTAWIFGYGETEACFRFAGTAGEKKELQNKLYKIKRLGRVLLNEIV